MQSGRQHQHTLQENTFRSKWSQLQDALSIDKGNTNFSYRFAYSLDFKKKGDFVWLIIKLSFSVSRNCFWSDWLAPNKPGRKKSMFWLQLCAGKAKKGQCYVVPRGGKSFGDCSRISKAARSPVSRPSVI